ncbi:hypothetical protein RchiOBHm_Chr4g0385541 [Rosa chinensis]|uniref:Uncharacterized protein n=1 Tax=Rosa chinensis TaxID=74649 RepID=A0A2P6QNY2_ROSCH|nr:uncharacterized protein LOC112195979 [Rosa chinensis]PRQ35899.1 hypothetical protein RchiOBHm_Chr4g0385541 [Rosa chinensis]
MRSKKTPVGFRVLGQRSLSSSFSSRSKIPVKVAEDDADKGSHGSLSDIPEQRLKHNSGTPKTVKVKSRPFLSLLGLKDLSGSTDDQIEAKKGGEAEKSSVALAFEKFKHTDIGKGQSIVSQSAGEAPCPDGDDLPETRKRRHPCKDGDDKHTARKYFAVLGGDPKPKLKKRRADSLISQEKPGHVYDHHENGCGWWDCNMEGIDNEEVGVNEVWEGVGSTTLGGIEWH